MRGEGELISQKLGEDHSEVGASQCSGFGTIALWSAMRPTDF